MLLKSWATPPASLPKASSLRAWRSCVSSAARSVTSIDIPIIPAMAPDGSCQGASQFSRTVPDTSVLPRITCPVITLRKSSATLITDPSESSTGMAP